MRGTLLVAGTASDAGKSVLVAGLCRWLARQGVKVAPFKAQNMSLNSFVTPDGAEIGRAQVMQAAAAGIEPTADMNPVLLKPGSDRRSQVVVLGHPETEADAVGYRAHAPRLRQVAVDSLNRLRDAYDVVICEGAGSPAEINLRDTDVANMGLARAAGLPVILAGDIDRGGVFAAMYGTLALLAPEDQALICGFVINKFRGAPELLDSGLTMLRQLTGRPVYGVLPWQDGLWLDAEDSCLFADHPATAARHRARSRVCADHSATVGATVCLRSASMIFSGWRWSGSRGSATSPTSTRSRPSPASWSGFATSPADLADADLVVLPGTRATVADLAWLRDRGLAAAVTERVRAGRPVLGICGGYQMLAGQIDDPVESRRGTVDGLGLLPVRVRFGAEKILAPPAGERTGRAGHRVRDPPRRRRGHRPGRRAVPGWLPPRRALGHQLARRAGERRVQARVPGRGGGAGRPGFPPRAGHQFRRYPGGAPRRARRPGRRAPRHRGAEPADRGRPGARFARACHHTQPLSIRSAHVR